MFSRTWYLLSSFKDSPYIMSDYGSECKDIGANYILTEEQCKHAAVSLQLTRRWALTNSSPKGCIFYNYEKDVYFNGAAQSGGNKAYSICLKGILQSYFN